MTGQGLFAFFRTLHVRRDKSIGTWEHMDAEDQQMWNEFARKICEQRPTYDPALMARLTEEGLNQLLEAQHDWNREAVHPSGFEKVSRAILRFRAIRRLVLLKAVQEEMPNGRPSQF